MVSTFPILPPKHTLPTAGISCSQLSSPLPTLTPSINYTPTESISSVLFRVNKSDHIKVKGGLEYSSMLEGLLSIPKALTSSHKKDANAFHGYGGSLRNLSTWEGESGGSLV